MIKSWHLAKLPFKWCGHRRCNDIGISAGIKGEHLDGRIVDLRKCGDGELAISDEAGQ